MPPESETHSKNFHITQTLELISLERRKRVFEDIKE